MTFDWTSGVILHFVHNLRIDFNFNFFFFYFHIIKMTSVICSTLSRQSTAVLNSPFCSHWLACANRLLMSLVTRAPHSLSYSACTSSSLAGRYSRHDFSASTHIPFSCNTVAVSWNNNNNMSSRAAHCSTAHKQYRVNFEVIIIF